MKYYTREELTNMTNDELNKVLKNISSNKTNLKKKKGIVDKEAELLRYLSYEDLVKEVKYSLMNKGKTYFEFSYEDIEALSIEELERFRKGISSKKCLDGNDFEILSRCEDLLEYSKQVLDRKRLEKNETIITKQELRTVLDNYNMHNDISLLLKTLEVLAL